MKTKKILTHLEVEEQLTPPLRVVKNSKELYGVRELWRTTYEDIYPGVSGFHQDPFDQQAHILFTKNAYQEVKSTARLVVDNPIGLPEDKYFPPEANMYREMGYKLMEFGRFVIHEGTRDLLKAYYRSVFEVAVAEEVDVIMMAMKQKDVAFHRNLIGAYLLSPDMHVPYAKPYKLACMAWEINNTKERFFRWTGMSEDTGVMV